MPIALHRVFFVLDKLCFGSVSGTDTHAVVQVSLTPSPEIPSNKTEAAGSQFWFHANPNTLVVLAIVLVICIIILLVFLVYW